MCIDCPTKVAERLSPGYLFFLCVWDYNPAVIIAAGLFWAAAFHTDVHEQILQSRCESRCTWQSIVEIQELKLLRFFSGTSGIVYYMTFLNTKVSFHPVNVHFLSKQVI